MDGMDVPILHSSSSQSTATPTPVAASTSTPPTLASLFDAAMMFPPKGSEDSSLHDIERIANGILADYHDQITSWNQMDPSQQLIKILPPLRALPALQMRYYTT